MNDRENPDYYNWKEAQKACKRLGIDSVENYHKHYKQDNKLPSSPALVYKDEWKVKKKWKGLLLLLNEKQEFHTWEKAQKACINLGIDSVEKYLKNYKKDPKLPSQPYICYKDVWESKGRWEGLFSKKKRRRFNCYSWEETKKKCKELGIKTSRDYEKMYYLDDMLPTNPHYYYKKIWVKNGKWKGLLGQHFNKVMPHEIISKNKINSHELAFLRREFGLSITEAAHIVGLSWDQWNQLESKTNNQTYIYARAIWLFSLLKEKQKCFVLNHSIDIKSFS